MQQAKGIIHQAAHEEGGYDGTEECQRCDCLYVLPEKRNIGLECSTKKQEPQQNIHDHLLKLEEIYIDGDKTGKRRKYIPHEQQPQRGKQGQDGDGYSDRPLKELLVDKSEDSSY